MNHKKLLKQIAEWYDNDEDQKIVDAILALPVTMILLGNWQWPITTQKNMMKQYKLSLV